jgi:hypothetical protein
LVVLTEKGEEYVAEKLAEEAEKEIIKSYGLYSKEYAELVSSLSRLYVL